MLHVCRNKFGSFSALFATRRKRDCNKGITFKKGEFNCCNEISIPTLTFTSLLGKMYKQSHESKFLNILIFLNLEKFTYEDFYML